MTKELEDYEYIQGELYIKATSIAKAIIGSPYDAEQMLYEELGLNKEGERI